MSVEHEESLKLAVKIYLGEVAKLEHIYGKVCAYLSSTALVDDLGLTEKIEFSSAETNLHPYYPLREFAKVLSEKETIGHRQVIQYIVENRERALDILSRRRRHIEELHDSLDSIPILQDDKLLAERK